MYFIDTVRRSARSLLSAKTRTILTAFAIAVGTFALTLTLGASNGAKAFANNIIGDTFDPSELIVAPDNSLFEGADTSKPQAYDPNSGSTTNGAGALGQIKRFGDSDLAKLKEVPGVVSVRPGFSINLQYLTRDGQKKYVGTVQAHNNYRKPELLAGSLPGNTVPSKSLILPEGFLGALGFKDAQSAVGQPVRLSVGKKVDQSSILNAINQGGLAAADKQIKNNAETATEAVFTVAAVSAKPSAAQPGSELYLYTNETDAIALNDLATAGTDNYHKYLTAYVKVADGTDEDKLKAAQASIDKLGYASRSAKDAEEFVNRLITVLQGIVGVFGMIAVIASVFGVVNTMYISVLQRTREIGLMKALGMHKRDIGRLFRIEAAFIGLLGGLLGSGLAVAAGTALNPLISERLNLGDERLLQFNYLQIAVLILGLIIIATISGLLPARKAARLDPIEALRVE